MDETALPSATQQAAATALPAGFKYVTTNPNLFTLSPNEEARVIKEDNEKRRILRLLQVRDAQRLASQKILANNRLRRDRAVQEIGEKLADEWRDEQQQKIDEVAEKLQVAEQEFGQGYPRRLANLESRFNFILATP